MNRIENVYPHCEIFIYDLEFIGDINNLQTCKIWDICVLHVKSKKIFNAVIDPAPGAMIFPRPPSNELIHLTRRFLNENEAMPFTLIFNKLIRWIDNRCNGLIPILISHNNFGSDQQVIEFECFRYGINIPISWYFFDSLIYIRDNLPKHIISNYSLSSLVEYFLKKPHHNAHRAYADTIALARILELITNNNMSNLNGSIYNPHHHSLRTLKGIGKEAENSFILNGIFTKETAIKFINYIIYNAHMNNKNHYQELYLWVFNICKKLPNNHIMKITNSMIQLVQ